ncbi:hypothetical protein [Actinophytocola sp.]|uniref:hypothetical protein n=1 Tax=Actinophytocola sp. TaxID=1872138 RepID=UPI002D7FB33E|nr:hypothetical protein [Actinophytocola sp.]HET9140958.1 hypothetical protein [Actinophytocola sp.]
MRRMFGRLGTMFEAIGYHAERYVERRGEDPVRNSVRRSRWGLIALAGFFGILVPIMYIRLNDDPRYLLVAPLSIATIFMALVMTQARTPTRAFGRLLLTWLFLILMFVAIALIQTLWPAPD